MRMPGFTAEASLHTEIRYSRPAPHGSSQAGKIVPQLTCACGEEDCTCCHCSVTAGIAFCHCWNAPIVLT